MHRLAPATDLTAARSARRRRAPRPLHIAGRVPDDRTAAAMDDEAEAAALIDDLLALIDAGLIEPVGSTLAPTALGWATDLGPDAA